MTSGAPRSHLWRHALPLLLGNWLQLSYNAVDSIIAGRFIGQNALAAEGIAGPVMNLVLLAITGIVHTGIAYKLYLGSMDQLEAHTIALFSYMDPILAIFLSSVLLKEPLTLSTMVGAVLILGAAYCSEK